jgi:peptidoglycan/LPS O-acetylase OafA/YrhL
MKASAAAHDRIPSLDGLRAISIAMVLLAHLAGTRGFPMSASSGRMLGLGELGVHVFFVISGFLITGLLMDELALSGRISLSRFYLRRTLRIFPAYYTYLAIVFLAAVAGWVQLAPHDLIHGLSYTSNYYPSRSWFMGHTWSLSVEEQFYLLWPALMVLAGPRRAVFIAAATLLTVPIIRVGSWELMRWAGDGIGHRFETVADAIAAGCVLAGVRPWLHESAPYKRALASPWFAAVPAIVVGANLLHDHPVVYFGAGLTLTNVGIALCLDRCVTHASGRTGRILNAAPMVFVGLISYSLYLWQQIFLNRESASALATFPLNLIFAVSAALASYYIVERPALRFRRWLEKREGREAREGRTPAIVVEAPAAAEAYGRGVN